MVITSVSYISALFTAETIEIHLLHYSLFCTLGILHWAEFHHHNNADLHRAPESSFRNVPIHLYAIPELQLIHISRIVIYH